jgi:ADP-heptose:LPS heptosyltransferase
MNVASLHPTRDMMMGLIMPILGRMVRPMAFSLPNDIGNHSRVLVIDSGELTEILFFSPVIEHLKSLCPGMRVTFLVRQGNSELVRSMHQINEMISYEPPHLSLSSTTYFSLLKRIRSRDFTVAFLLGTEFNFARSFLALLTQAKIRVGFSSDFSFPFINCEVRQSTGSIYESERIGSYLTALGFRGNGPLPSWSLPEQDIRWAKQMVHFHKPKKDVKLVVADPGLGKGRHRLVDDSFAFLLNHLVRRMPCQILVHSNNMDKKGLEKFKSKIKTGLLDLEPKNVKEGLALLSCADLLLAGNTDYFHFGVNMRVPTVGLFTRHDSMNWFPKSAPWVQILQGVKGQRLSLEEFFSKIDTLLHLTRVE